MADQVLVVGAGPVGLTMALALKRHGVDVRIVERAAERTDKSKALVLWPRTLELLSVFADAEPFVAAGLQGRGGHILAAGKLLVHLDFTAARSRYRYALMVPQSETERILEEQLLASGVTVERRVELAGFTENAAGISATLTHLCDSRTETVVTPWLCACDGAHSTVRHALGVPFTGSTLPSDWMLADLRIEGSLPPDEMTLCWAPDGVLVFFPINKERFRVIADIGVVTEAQAVNDVTREVSPPTLAEVQTVMEQRGPAGLRAHDPVWLSRFRINERKVAEYRHGRVFLCGDAAHVHSPAGGQGMNTGMQDAINLAWKLALVCNGVAGRSLLDSYSPERSAIGDQVLRSAGTMTRIAMLRNPILQELRSLAIGTLGHLPMLRQKMIDQLTEIDLHYAEGPPALALASHGSARHPAIGARAPDTAITAHADAGGHGKAPSLPYQSLYQALGSGRFVVLAVGSTAVELPAHLWPIAVSVAASTSASASPSDMGAADRREAYDDGHLYLIRPDAYVATSCALADPGPIVALLERLSAAS